MKPPTANELVGPPPHGFDQKSASLMKLTLLLLLTVLLSSCSKHHVKEVGGTYGYSPDGKWMAQINDGYSETHKLPYAVVRLWDLRKYPSLKDGTRFPSYSGKAATVRFEFPQDFQARDSACNLSWETNSLGFSITFRSPSYPITSGTTNLRSFHYDLSTDTFSLARAE